MTIGSSQAATITTRACPRNASSSTPSQPNRTAKPTNTGCRTTPTSARTAAKSSGPPGGPAWKPESSQSQIHTAGTVTRTAIR